MKSKTLTSFQIDDAVFQFNLPLFNELFKIHASERGYKFGAYENILAEQIGVDSSSIHNWRNKLNGPGDIDLVKEIAKIWSMDYFKLLIEKEDKNMNSAITPMNSEEKASVYKIYNKVLDALIMLKKTKGFTKAEYDKTHTRIEQETAYELRLTLEREYPNIRHSLYEELDNLIWEIANIVEASREIYIEAWEQGDASSRKINNVPGESLGSIVEYDTDLYLRHLKSIIDKYKEM